MAGSRANQSSLVDVGDDSWEKRIFDITEVGEEEEFGVYVCV
jgi:hypothetical protein